MTIGRLLERQFFLVKSHDGSHRVNSLITTCADNAHICRAVEALNPFARIASNPLQSAIQELRTVWTCGQASVLTLVDPVSFLAQEPGSCRPEGTAGEQSSRPWLARLPAWSGAFRLTVGHVGAGVRPVAGAVCGVRPGSVGG